jgi:hypothetical protein
MKKNISDLTTNVFCQMYTQEVISISGKIDLHEKHLMAIRRFLPDKH